MRRFLKGWVRIRITGRTPERFLNLCRKHGLVLWDLTAAEEGVWASMYEADCQSCEKLAEKAEVLIERCEEHGLRFLLLRYRNRQAFFVMCALVLLVLRILTLFVWDIQIENNRYYSDDQILSFLQEQGIARGTRCRKVDCEKVEALLRDHFERISWSAAKVEGTVLKIELAENYGTLEVSRTPEEPADLIAQMDGTVRSLVVRKGIAQVQIGDAVTKGQVLVAGSIPLHDDAQEVADYEFVRADASVMLETTLPYEDSLDPVQSEKVYVRKGGSRYYIGNAGGSLCLPTPGLLLRHAWQTIRAAGGGLAEKTGLQSEEKNAGNGSKKGSDCIGTGFSHLYLPEFSLSLFWHREEIWDYEIRYRCLTEREAAAVLQEKIRIWLEKLKKNQMVVVENQVRIYYDAVVYRASGNLRILVPQAGYQSIDYRAYRENEQVPQSDTGSEH